MLENTGADGENRSLGNATIAVPLKYFFNFRGSLEMLLISCKVELKLKWTKHGVLFLAGADNTVANLDNYLK